MDTDATDAAAVLVVDDDETVVDTYTNALEGTYTVRAAYNSGEAMVELSHDVDVVLLDRRLPGMSGDEFLAHIREWEHDCRVVMVSAVDPGSDIVDMAFDDYLTKPVSPDELISTIDQLLLLDRYEKLLKKYHSVTKKYALLKSRASGGNLAVEELDELAAQRDRLEADLGDVIDSFDEDVADVLRQAHAEPRSAIE